MGNDRSDDSLDSRKSALIWWALYMHVFYFAFKIEQARRQPRVDLAATFE